MFAADDLSKVAQKRSVRGKGKAKRLKRTESDESNADSESEGEETKKCKDDGDLAYYEKRLDAHSSKQSHLDSGADFLFDGGLKVPSYLWKRLYKYQKTGVKWLWELHCQQVGGILGDEMGLGKTVQIIAFLASLHYSKVLDKASQRFRGLGPTIIVTPVTVMHQWVKEFHTWYPPIRVAILHASGSSTAPAASLLHSLVGSFGVVITSYSTFLNYQDEVLRHSWQYIILDEGHKIRNPDAQITVAVKRVRTVHKIILSGSPIQNNLKELWSLYDFVFPGRLGMLVEFMEHFAVPITQGGYANASQTQVLTAYKCATVLRDTISPYLIRRMKADVNQKQLKLPEKREHVLFCRLTEEQRKVYEEYLSSSEVANILSGRLLVFPGLIKLRKICNHPDLTTGDLRTKYTSGKISELEREYGYYKRSGKLVVCKALLKMWNKKKRKVLLFTQSSQMLDILESFVLKEGYSYVRMDGGTPIGSRHVIVNKFNQDKNIFVFLLTTRVGGLGVNLVAASRIVIFDPDWNPSTDMQARERAWRIGQQRDVIIYRLVCTGSIEEKIYQRQIFKQFLTNRILSNPKQRRFFRSGDLKDLFSLAVEDEKLENSETHAIFAGTGSRIDLKGIQEKALLARQQAKQKAKEKAAEEARKKEKMWELAKKLSEEIEVNKQKSDADDPDASDSKKEETQVTSSLTSTESKALSRALASETRNIMNLELFGNLGDLEFEAELDDADNNGSREENLNLAKCEGHIIPGLTKVRKWKHSQKEEKEPLEDNSTQNGVEDEEYILSKLLKKSLLNGAMKHDTIVDACNTDYAIVEAEADRVAKQAAEHLRRAKKRMRSYNDGGANPKAKQRFGVKSISDTNGAPSKMADNLESVKSVMEQSSRPSRKDKASKILQTSNSATSSRQSPANAEKSVKRNRTLFFNYQVFDGKKLSFGDTNRVFTESDVPLPSHVLLAAMRRRQGVPEELCDSRHASLTEDIREFIASKRNTAGAPGFVGTQEIIDEFSSNMDVLPATFRAILREICHFSKVNGQGRWVLKEEFE